MKISFNGISKIGELDYITSWYIKASRYINETVSCAFVTTSSICQGSQVQQLWPNIYRNGIGISFAYKPFRWTNNAKDKAGVIVSIIGIKQTSRIISKYLFYGNLKKEVNNINPYLLDSSNVVVYQSLKPISDLPPMITGNSPYDGGNLILSSEEKDKLLSESKESSKFIKKIHGSKDYLNGKERWCLWISDKDLEIAKEIVSIRSRIEKTKIFRENGGEVARGLVYKPHQFRYTYSSKNNLIIIPRVSSERRKYIPFGFLDNDYIVSDSAQAIYDPEPYVLGIVLSSMHMIWVKITGGYLGTSIRYSSALCYNTFPFPNISKKRKEELTQTTMRILEEREKCSDKTLAQLYDPDKMPEGLREAHRLNDEAVERCYRSKPFETDEERLEYLFKLYEKMIASEKAKEIELKATKKTRKKK